MTVNKYKGNTNLKAYFFMVLSIIFILYVWSAPLVVNSTEGTDCTLDLSTGIIPPLRDQINITSPRSEDIWFQGEDRNITFVSWYHGPETHSVMEGYTMDFILLYSGEYYEEWIIEEGWNELENLESPYGTQIVHYFWHIPETLPNGKSYQILIRVKQFSELVYDYYSDIFTIGTVSDAISGFPIGPFIGSFIVFSLALVFFLNKKKLFNKCSGI